MKEIVCEVCGSHDFMKKDGAFVCQNCGMKYSQEEVRKLLVDTDTDSKEDLKRRAKNALEHDQGDEALRLAEKIVQMDENDAEGWHLKFLGMIHQFQLSGRIFEDAFLLISKAGKLNVSLYPVMLNEILNRMFEVNICSVMLFRQTDEIRALYHKLERSNPFTASDITASQDIDRDARDAIAKFSMHCVEKLPDGFLQEKFIHLTAKNVSDSFLQETEALDARMKIYGKRCHDKEQRLKQVRDFQERLTHIPISEKE